MIELQRTTIVQETRSIFQQAMQGQLIETVERLSGRRVLAFISNQHVGRSGNRAVAATAAMTEVTAGRTAAMTGVTGGRTAATGVSALGCCGERSMPGRAQAEWDTFSRASAPSTIASILPAGEGPLVMRQTSIEVREREAVAPTRPDRFQPNATQVLSGIATYNRGTSTNLSDHQRQWPK